MASSPPGQNRMDCPARQCGRSNKTTTGRCGWEDSRTDASHATPRKTVCLTTGFFQILEDDYGWMWMSCNRGIYRVRKQELNDFADGRLKTIICLAYNKNDGM